MFTDFDGLCRVDITVAGPCIKGVVAASDESDALGAPRSLDMRGAMLLPCFVDMHTHIGACATGRRRLRGASPSGRI